MDLQKKNTLTVFQKKSVRKALNRLNDKRYLECVCWYNVGLGKNLILQEILLNHTDIL